MSEGPVRAVSAVIFRDDGAVLLVRRRNPPNADQFFLPGGRLEPNESEREAVVREVREETALDVEPLIRLDEVSVEATEATPRFTIGVHRARLVGTTSAVAASDAADARWVHDHELEGLGVSDATRALIAAARRVTR